jgi:hypothetical protein
MGDELMKIVFRFKPVWRFNTHETKLASKRLEGEKRIICLKTGDKEVNRRARKGR